jgi:hypothetical protein
MGEMPAPEIPTLDDIYVAENNTGLAMYCDKCGQEFFTAVDTAMINVGDAIVAAGSHIREHQEQTREDEYG